MLAVVAVAATVAAGCAGGRYEPQTTAVAAYTRFVDGGMGRGDIEGACAVVSDGFRSTLKKQGTNCEEFVKSRQRPQYAGLSIDAAFISEGQRMTRVPGSAVKLTGGTVPFDVVITEVARGFGSGWVVDAVEEGGR